MYDMDFDILHTIRNPLSAVSSVTNNYIQKSGYHFFAKSIFDALDVIVNGIKQLRKLNKKLFLIQLEMLHRNHSEVMNNFCETYNLKYDDCMKYSTYFNLNWWGDEVSVKDLNGINKDFKINFKKETFYTRDIKFLEYILSDYIVFYGYKFNEKTSKFFFNLLPMKCEILAWKNTFKHKRLKHILSIPFFYIKRLLFVNKFSQKNLNMPRAFGME